MGWICSVIFFGTTMETVGGVFVLHTQDLSGFEVFSKNPSFNTLCSAHSRGPVIIITYCEWSSEFERHLQR
jgi:hypothetical protein